MRNKNRPLPGRPILRDNGNGWAPILPLFSNLIYIIILAAAFYMIQFENLFPDYQSYILMGLKILIVIQIIFASVKSILAPIAIIALGGAAVYGLQNNLIITNLVTVNDAWGLVITGIVGLIITIIVKSADRY